MEILYVIAMVAVFVLCLALLSTARRILRSSPLASGSLALARIYDGERSEEGLLEDEMPADEMAMHRMEAQYADSNLLPDKPVVAETTMAAMVMPGNVIIEASAVESILETFEEQGSPILAEEPAAPVASALPRMNKAIRIRKPSRQAYNYALECLLLGVSAWVLIKTQRSNSRYRFPRPSRDRVA